MGAGLAAVATASLLATDAHTGLTEDTTHWQQRFNCLWVLAKSSKSLNSNQGKRRNSCLLLPFFSGFFFGGGVFCLFGFFSVSRSYSSKSCLYFQLCNPPGSGFESRAEPDPRELLHLFISATRRNERAVGRKHLT